METPKNKLQIHSSHSTKFMRVEHPMLTTYLCANRKWAKTYTDTQTHRQTHTHTLCHKGILANSEREKRERERGGGESATREERGEKGDPYKESHLPLKLLLNQNKCVELVQPKNVTLGKNIILMKHIMLSHSIMTKLITRIVCFFEKY